MREEEVSVGTSSGRSQVLSEREGGKSRRGMSCWGARPRGIGGSRRSRGARGCERRGVDDLGKMGERSRAGLQKGGSRHALAGRGRCREQDQNQSVAGMKVGQCA